MSSVPAVEPLPTPASTPSLPTMQADLAVCLPSMPSDELAAVVGRLGQTLQGESLLIVAPNQTEEQEIAGGTGRWVPYPLQRTESEWVLNAADYSAAARVVEQYGVSGVLLLGSDAGSLDDNAVRALRQALEGKIDLALPRYRTGPEEGLVNAALLYPLTRALFGVDIRYPLPLDAALSPRMLTRLANAATHAGAPQEEALLWPVAEAAIAGFSVRQTDGGARTLPRPHEADLNVLFSAVTSSLFSDIENKATFWQRARSLPAPRQFTAVAAGLSADDADEIRSLVDNFRSAFANLREIWSLVLPPQTLLALKKLSQMAPENFAFAPSLWARVVYDFALAFHMRTLNRGHLLGALMPLYLAWVASRLREGDGNGLLEGTASAFEQEKPYLVSRWRWPDRFNP